MDGCKNSIYIVLKYQLNTESWEHNRWEFFGSASLLGADPEPYPGSRGWIRIFLQGRILIFFAGSDSVYFTYIYSVTFFSFRVGSGSVFFCRVGSGDGQLLPGSVIVKKTLILSLYPQKYFLCFYLRSSLWSGEIIFFLFLFKAVIVRYPDGYQI